MIREFYLGARPKTLSAAVAPVLIGASLAWEYNEQQLEHHTIVDSQVSGDMARGAEVFVSHFSWWITLLCLIVAVALQIGVNYANDYSDGRNGTDDNRVGPMRLVGSGAASPRSVLIATWISFAIAAIAGLAIAIGTTLWFIVVGVACMILAWFYTGGKQPYGYYGYGELVVFICFGLVATVGTFVANTYPYDLFSQSGHIVITWESFVAGCIPGFYSVAILLANNIRDMDTDRKSGKKTLPVRIGRTMSNIVYGTVLIGIVIATIFLIPQYPSLWIVFIFTVATGLSLSARLIKAERPPEYISILVRTSQYNLITALLFSVLIIFGTIYF